MGQPGNGDIGGVVHDFSERLAFSAKLSDEPSWVEFYRSLWPDMVSSVRLDRDSAWQRDGIDRIVFLSNGREVRIDEKKRDPTKDYKDILLEEWSVFHGEGRRDNKIGWALDGKKRCDYIAYWLPYWSRCYFLPFELLRLAFIANRSKWERSFGHRLAPNAGYKTRNIPVPWEELRVALNEQMTRRFGNTDLVLPTPFVVRDQLLFSWAEQER